MRSGSAGKPSEGRKPTFIEAARRSQIVRAAAETIAELGYARASLARIAERAGISKGLILYHFDGKEALVDHLLRDVLEQAVAYIQPRVAEQESGPGMLRALIESNLAFMAEHREHLVAFYEVAVQRRSSGEAVTSTRWRGVAALSQLLAESQARGEFRSDFDPFALAVAIRAAIDAVPPLLAADPAFDVAGYAHQLAEAFDRATRNDSKPRPGKRTEHGT